MKTTQTLGKLIALSLIASATLHATNGDNLIAVGAKARGMGGTGIAVSHGAESSLGNGAMITSVEGTEIDFGGTIFLPDIETTITGFNPGFGVNFTDPSFTSDADTNMIPEVSIVHKINENWYIGVGMWGTAGLGVDYSNATGGAFNNFNMVTNLQLLQFGVPIAYKTEGLSLAVTPVMQYGNLDINYDSTALGGSSVGAGLAQDFGFGYNLGLAYDFAAQGMAGLTFGATYKSSIEMEYKHQLTTAVGPFTMGQPLTLLPNGDKLEQPSEYGLGLAYVMGQHTFAFDYKNIQWSDAKGYQDFGWEDQDVYAFGYQYTQDNWALRAGYNYADSAVVEGMDPRLNFFNLLGFPATAQSHYTLGGSYGITEAFSVDLAYVYAPTTTETYDISALFGPGANVSTDHREDSLSIQLAYKF
ncbi:MAG TPA: outer membrane protein transport protein [Sulfurovum sp.]|nr:MAG: aromatic hydrocarbon degradation protein [Sulfurovum sp. 35-42-20]OYZ25398.1 MAG: aromatic hydrocarbon degradation protein [Sulfurovum sp. 16-42-52]OZA45494.1 MAG: aromatic hydrocarbon degradation protein [Sulfurovum sp. 17-42-90]HQS72878.1 outer membrane protein transport protein [Sulfurovum sp.]HQT29021.1 outer membrane protein transport protein [Sulfurovum sp.]